MDEAQQHGRSPPVDDRVRPSRDCCRRRPDGERRLDAGQSVHTRLQGDKVTPTQMPAELAVRDTGDQRLGPPECSAVDGAKLGQRERVGHLPTMPSGYDSAIDLRGTAPGLCQFTPRNGG